MVFVFVFFVSLQITNSLEQVMDFMDGTLLSVQKKQVCLERSLWEVTQECVELLKEKGLVTVSTEPQDRTLQVTKLGRATYKGELLSNSPELVFISFLLPYKEIVHSNPFKSCYRDMFFFYESMLQCLVYLTFNSSGSVDLTYCDLLYRDLSKGLESLMLNSFLHLIYLVTPYDMVSQCKPDWMVYFRQVRAQVLCASWLST